MKFFNRIKFFFILIFKYVGVNYLKTIGIDNLVKFSTLQHICSWALCGFGNTNNKELNEQQKQTNVEKDQIFYDVSNHW